MAEKVQGFTSLINGQQGSVASVLLKDTQYVRGVNVSSRGGLIHTRDKFISLGVVLPGSKFQGAYCYSLNSGDRIVVVADGVPQDIMLDTGIVTEHTTHLSATPASVTFVQADKYLVIQDGVTPAVIIEETAGVDVSRASISANDEIPLGTIMCYVHGRIFMVPVVVPGVSESGKRFFIAGDILMPNDPGNVLKFTETGYIAEGGAIGLPGEFGFIGGMLAFRNAATGTGAGALVVCGRRGMSAFAANASRTQWKDMDFGQVLFSKIGSKSPRSFVNINDDIFFRALDGFRTVRFSKSMTADASGSLSNVPLSGEVQDFVKLDEKAAIPFVSASSANNQILVTVAGHEENGEIIFDGLVSMDTAIAYSLSGPEAPAYDGVYTGLKFLQVLEAERNGEIIHIIVARTARGIELFRLGEGIVDGTASRVPARIYTKAMTFNDQYTPLSDRKRLACVEMALSKLQGIVNVRVLFRPLGTLLWNPMGSFQIEVPAGSLPHRLISQRLTLSTQYCDSAGGVLNVAEAFEFCVEWIGEAQIEWTRFAVEPQAYAPKVSCMPTVLPKLEATTTTGSVMDDFAYEVLP